MAPKDHRIKAKSRRSSGQFAAVPLAVMQHPNFISLSPKANKLIFDLLVQMRFKPDQTANNGDLQATWKLMKERGWRSKETLENATRELCHYGFLTLTRQGGRHCCSLFALTFFAIDECKGKIDCRPTTGPPNDWQEIKRPFTPSRKKPSAGKTETVPRKSVISAPSIVAIAPKRVAK